MLIGNLTRDPELRQTPKGTSVTDIGIAINRVFTSDAGERQEEVTFVDVTLWDRLAENAAKYLRKGSPVFVEGRLKLDTWDDKESGQSRQRLRVVADRMQFLGSPAAGRNEQSEDTSEAGGAGTAQRDARKDADSRAQRDPDKRGPKPRRATFA